MSTRTEIKYESKIQGKESEKIRYLATAGIMAALITLMTAYICHIPVGTNGGSETLCPYGSCNRRRTCRSPDSTYVGTGDHHYQDADYPSFYQQIK